jgi:glyoxylate reductase
MATERARLFVSQPIPASALERLKGLADVTVGGDASRILPRPELVEKLRQADVFVHLMHDAVDAQAIAAATRLKLIASMAIVPATVDMAAATARKIAITTIPPIVTEATADLHFALLLAAARRVVEADAAVRGGLFPGSQSMHFAGAGVHGKTIGIVGLGRIGRAIARRARGFDMAVLYTKQSRLSEDEERQLGATYVNLDDLLARSDYLSVSCSLTPQTRHLVGARELKLVRPSAILVNTARGPVVDEAALVAALNEGRLAGAGLDVYEEEPRVHPGLLPLRNVVLLPHLGSAVFELRERMAHVVADNVQAFLEGRRPPNLHNPEIYG